MKRSLIVLFGMFLMLSQPVMAKTIHVQAMEGFSTENPPSTISVRVIDELVLDENITLNQGDILKGKIVDVQDPKRLKRDATFSFVPYEYKDRFGNVHTIKEDYTAKYTTKFNKGEAAKSAALSVGNYFVKGLSMGYNAIEGAVKNEKDNRLKSSVNAVYESSPFSYVEKGEYIVIEKYQNFLLNFRTKEEEKAEEPNYQYELVEPDNSVK
ncbi:MAG: hypothetical protein ACLSWI_04190 [Candidatus Gastranaerophilaceae bacterium]